VTTVLKHWQVWWSPSSNLPHKGNIWNVAPPWQIPGHTEVCKLQISLKNLHGQCFYPYLTFLTSHQILICFVLGKMGCEGTVNAGDQTLQDTRFLWQHGKEIGCCHVGIHALVWRGRGMLTKMETALTKYLCLEQCCSEVLWIFHMSGW